MLTISLAGDEGFADELRGAANGVSGDVAKVLKHGALNIKRQLVSEMRASKSFKGIARSISYNTDNHGLYVEIGPRKPGPGALANIAYFGSSRGGGTVPDPKGALEVEMPRIENEIGKILKGL